MNRFWIGIHSWARAFLGGEHVQWVFEVSLEDESNLRDRVTEFIREKNGSAILACLPFEHCGADLHLRPEVADSVVPMCFELMKSGAIECMVIYAWGELATAAEVNISIGLDTERVRWQIYRKAIKELRQYAQDYEVPVLLANPHTGSYPFLTTI